MSSFNQPLEGNQIQGFIHKLSDIRTSTIGAASYFDFQLQTSPTKSVRALCYSPEKRPKIKEMQDKKQPVSFDNVQQTVGRRRALEEEYTIRKKSRVTPHIVDYEYDPAFSQMHFSISEIDDISDFQSISVKAKVMLIGESEVVNVRGKPLTKIDYIIADSTKSIKLLAWENKVVLEADKSYHIEGISVRSFNDEKYLTTTKYTSIHPIEELVAVNDGQCDYGNVVVGSVLGVSVSHYKICLCNTKIQVDDNTTTVKCNKCKLTVFANALLDSSVTKLIIKDFSSQMHTYTALNTTMDTFLHKVANKSVTDCDDEQLLEFFAYKTFEFTVSEKEKLVSSITVNTSMQSDK